MKVHLLDEPPLQFASGRHIDIRAGLMKYGAFSRNTQRVPNPIGVGIIGTPATADALEEWLSICSRGVATSEKKLVELRPSFPGMNEDVFGTKLKIAEIRTITRTDLEDAFESRDALSEIVDLFLGHAGDLSVKPHIHVLLVAPPAEVFNTGRPPSDDSEEQDSVHAHFHDVFKARALSLRTPCQLIRPDTYGGDMSRAPDAKRASLQDLATRAWNIHTALYYKAGGVPWRLVNPSSGLDTCYVGTSFYENLDRDTLVSSVAQVFDELGEGLILKGANARYDEDDRTPHLREKDARDLLWNSLQMYKREHKHMPARVVVHKTSYFDDEELDGFREAAKEQKITTLDLVWARPSKLRLFRAAEHAVRRGTALQIDDARGIIYLKGTVPYFRIYPGPYVPRPIEFVREDGETPVSEIAKEMLELSKLNFNNTQFDSGDPITIRAARRIGDILKHVRAGEHVETQFRYVT